MASEKGFISKLGMLYAYLFKDFDYSAGSTESADYEAYWQEPSQAGRGVKPKYVSLAGLLEPNATVLDIGCGDGTLLRYLTETKNIQGKGIDVSERALALAREKGIEVYQGDLTDDSFAIDGSYDYILMIDVLEHLPNPEKVLVKTKGRFRRAVLLLLPNTGFIVDRLRLLFGRFPRQWEYWPWEHLRFWTVKDFLFWSRSLGFRVKRCYGTPLAPAQFFKLWKYWPSLFARYVIYELVEGGRNSK